MGLHASFDLPDTDITVLEAIHLSFLTLFLEEQPEPVDDGDTDFWVDASLLDEVELTLIERFDNAGISLAISTATEIEDLRHYGEDAFEHATLLHLHLGAVRRLRQAVMEHGPLVCAWSA
jgi:hypothetical protein